MSQKTAVIGAGIAGLACARRLAAAGHAVVLYDKGRVAGGRLATRRLADPATGPTFACAGDTGAQYFTVRDPEFAERIAEARIAGRVAEWRPRWPDDTREREPTWVGAPAMNRIGPWFARGLDVRLATRIVALERRGAEWRLRDELDSLNEGYGTVVLALPAPQAAALAGDRLDPRIARVELLPCWAVVVAWPVPLGVPLDADWRPHPVLPWLARDVSKPGRGGLDTWVLHASAEWSAANLERPADEVAAELVAALPERLAAAPGGSAVALPEPVATFAHRWRYARVANPLGEDCWWDPAQRLGACGDWCLDARVEAAYVSGRALGERIATGGG